MSFKEKLLDGLSRALALVITGGFAVVISAILISPLIFYGDWKESLYKTDEFKVCSYMYGTSVWSGDLRGCLNSYEIRNNIKDVLIQSMYKKKLEVKAKVLKGKNAARYVANEKDLALFSSNAVLREPDQTTTIHKRDDGQSIAVDNYPSYVGSGAGDCQITSQFDELGNFTTALTEPKCSFLSYYLNDKNFNLLFVNRDLFSTLKITRDTREYFYSAKYPLKVIFTEPSLAGFKGWEVSSQMINDNFDQRTRAIESGKEKASNFRWWKLSATKTQPITKEESKAEDFVGPKYPDPVIAYPADFKLD